MTEAAERIVVDTDVASRLLRGTLDASMAARLGGAVLLLSFVTVGELLRGARHAGWGERRTSELETWLEAMPVIGGTRGISRQWGQITGAGMRTGRPHPANDGWVAACCLFHRLPLATGDVRHFRHFRSLAELELIECPMA